MNKHVISRGIGGREAANLGTDDRGSLTRYRTLGRLHALLVLTVVLGSVMACLAASRKTGWSSLAKGPGDAALYAQVVESLRHGTPYYEALGSELRSRNYPSSSVFNWRTPLHLQLLARLRDPAWSRGLIILAAFGGLALAFAGLIRRRLYTLAVLQLFLLCIPLAAAATPMGYLFAEMWAGVLITFSIAAYAFGWRYAGMAAAIIALFFRELALPYFAICGILTFVRASRGELALWIAGLAGWCCYFGVHTSAVLSHLPANASLASALPWIRFGGLQFLLSTSRVGLLLAFPLSVTAVYLPLAVFGLAGWISPASSRLSATVAVYLIAFSIVGMPVNFYWGGIYSPLLAFGAPWALPAARDLLLALRPDSARQHQRPAHAGTAG